MKLVIDVTQEPSLEGMARSAKREAMKAAHHSLGMFWMKGVLPAHFKLGARSRYGYKPRSKAHATRKRKQGKPRQDHVFTGVAKSIATQPRLVRAFPSRATVRIPGPSYYTLRPRKPTRVNLVREVLTLDNADKQNLEQAAGKAWAKAVVKVRIKSRKKHRG